MVTSASAISSSFLWRRIHSLMGLWLVLYLLVHLLTNSQAALWIGDDGHGFVQMVNSLESLPYLQAVETLFIGIPLLLHGVWGIKRLFSAKTNAGRTQGESPSLSYERNRAFTWQRLSAWILLFGILGHVAQMRFLDRPQEAVWKDKRQYLTPLTFDEGLYTLSQRLHVALYSAEEIQSLGEEPSLSLPIEVLKSPEPRTYSLPRQELLDQIQKGEEEHLWIQALKSYRLSSKQVLAVAPNPGTAILLKVRDTFKSPLMVALYTAFVLAAAYHAFNGFWTALITWGALLSYRSQRAMLPVAWIGIAFLAFLGLAAVWGSYWINLRY